MTFCWAPLRSATNSPPLSWFVWTTLSDVATGRHHTPPGDEEPSPGATEPITLTDPDGAVTLVAPWSTWTREQVRAPGGEPALVTRLEQGQLWFSAGRRRSPWRHEVRIGISIDGPKELHDQNRVDWSGKGSFDRYGLDARYTSRWLPGFMIQGEVWQGHDGSNPTIVGTPAQGDCLNRAFCGGSGAPGVQRRTWYVLAKYLISSGPLKDFEPVVMYEQFDPNTAVSNDMFTRTIVGFNYYFENLPPKIQSKLSVNYEFRHHQGTGPATTVANNDPFAQNAFLVQFQIRYQ